MPKITDGQFALGGLALFVIWVFVVLPFLYGPPPRFAESGRPPKPHSEQVQQQAASKPDGSESAPFFIKIPKTAEEAAQEAEDRRDKATTDRWLMIFTGAVALFTLLLVGATILLYRAGEKQIEVAAKTAEAAKKSADAALIALRPWISCKVEISGPLTYTPDGDAEFMFCFIVENVGHSPAFGVRLTPSLNLLRPKHESSIVKLQRMAQFNREMPVRTVSILVPGGIPIGGAELGLILFPNDPYQFNYKFPVKRVDIESSCEDIKPNMHFFPEVFGLVTYTYPLADVRADTGFVRGINNVSPDSTSGLAFELGDPVQVEHLRVADHSLWSGFAT